jgi:hypothetical protein
VSVNDPVRDLTDNQAYHPRVVGVRVTIGVGLALAVLAPAPVDATPRPALALVRTNPLQVRASGFHSGESVRLTVRARGVAHANATADRDGRFNTTISGATVSRCGPLTVRATGSGGSRAALRRSPRCPVRDG